MTALRLAALGLVRQPARGVLGILGVAAVGALLFDMLLLSRGLIVSMQELLERTGWDVRVTSGDDLFRRDRRVHAARATARALSALPEVHSALAIRIVEARIDRAAGGALRATLVGTGGVGRPPWTVLHGRDAAGADEVVISPSTARAANAAPGALVALAASCGSDEQALPTVHVRVAGIAEFPFEVTREHTLGGTLEALAASCGVRGEDEADLILVRSGGDPAAAAGAIHALRSDLRALTNDEVIGRLQQTGFTYFRQISTVLATVTLAFALLLISVLLTVSVNQRLGELAALRALGFSRLRGVQAVFAESALIVGTGGVLSLPLGVLLAMWLDRILRQLPGIPAELHFFVFEPRALGTHVVLLVATSLLAALYPMRIVARLPIATTLRNEIGG
jgi:putative ABC transport system permease protein